MDNLLVVSTYGSHLYGVATQHSDLDFKRVFVPSFEKLLHGGSHDTFQEKKELTETKVEYESYAISKYVDLLRSGNSIALEILFTPPKYRAYTTEDWDELYAHRSNLLSSNLTSFVGYCRSQAAKYGKKGNKFSTIDFVRNKIFTHFDKLSPAEKREKINRDFFNSFYDQVKEMGGISIVTKGTNNVYFNILEKMIDLDRPIHEWIPIIESIYNSYGERARKAVEGQDWKAMYHSVRIASQAIELINEQTITFPRPEAALLLEIRSGLKPIEEVEELITSLVDRVLELEKTEKVKSLKVDEAFLDHWLLKTAKKHIL